MKQYADQNGSGLRPMSDRTFRQLGDFIQSHTGIKMPPVKKVMVQARLMKRMRALNLPDYETYRDYVFASENENELIHMLDVITTNKTEFFREPAHFDHLVKHALPDLISRFGAGTQRPLQIWSAGCSTGEEPYTLSMVLSEFQDNTEDFQYRILASDLSTHVLQKARDAIYTEEKAQSIPAALRKKYLLRSKDRNSGLVRIAPAYRKNIRFMRLNFMDDHYPIQVKMDIIFCRNVIIYFERDTQEKLLNKFSKHLRKGGYLYMGHSETLNGLNVPYISVAPTVYRKAE